MNKLELPRLSHLALLAIARITSTFIAGLIVTILWIDTPNAADGFTFLALTFKELAFPAGPSIGTNVEATIINSLAIILSIAFCGVGKVLAALAVRRTDDGPITRAIPALFLAFLGFSSGYLRSSSPRLTIPTRIASITAVFLLTNEIGVSHVNHHAWTDFLIVTAVAAGSSLIPTLLFLRDSVRSYPCLVVNSLAQLREHISTSVERAFPPPRDNNSTSTGTAPVTPVLTIQTTTNGGEKEKKDREKAAFRLPPAVPRLVPSAEIHRAFAQSFLEMHYNRVHVKEIRPFIYIIDRLRTELSWGSIIPEHMHTSSEYLVYSAIEHPCKIISSALTSSLLILENIISYAYDVPSSPSHPPSSSSPLHPIEELEARLKLAREDLTSSVKLLKLQLATMHVSLERKRKSEWAIPRSFDSEDAGKEVFSVSLFCVSLLQLAADMHTALRVGEHVINKTKMRKTRKLWLPKLTREWFKSHSSPIIHDVNDFNVEQFVQDSGYTEVEENEATIEEEEEADAAEGSDPLPPPASSAPGLARLRRNSIIQARYKLSSWQLLWSFKFKKFWASLIGPRRRVSRFVMSVRHSRHLQYALKNAVGIMALALPVFLPRDKGGSWFQSVHGQWAVASYIYVLESNTGATIRTGVLRFMATVAGAIYAYVAFEISHQNPYAIVIFVTLSELPISWYVLRTPYQAIGVVAAITLPPVLFANLHRVESRSTILIAVDRVGAISVGILAAVLMNHFVYTRTSRRIFLDLVAKSLGRFNDLYLSLSRTLSKQWVPHPDYDARDEYALKNVKLENEIRETLFNMNALIGIMHLEISILPKPMKTYRHLTRTLQRAIDVMVGLRRVRDHIPKKETVADVMPYRREVISTICMSLFALEATFRTGSALPQFLPSPQHALDALIREKELHLALPLAPDSPETPRPSSLNSRRGMSKEVLLSFSRAENALLGEFVSLVQEILRIARTLHGVEQWLDEDELALPLHNSTTTTPKRVKSPPLASAGAVMGMSMGSSMGGAGGGAADDLHSGIEVAAASGPTPRRPGLGSSLILPSNSPVFSPPTMPGTPPLAGTPPPRSPTTSMRWI